MEFKGTSNYVAPRELQIAVNAAVHLQKPLLVKGEPGTGKTLLAHEIAKALKKPLITWHIKSTTLAQQGLYEYDAVSRLRDSQLGGENVDNIEHYIKKGKLWEAFSAKESVVLLIDEIDKADTQKTIKAKIRPIVIITSNNEKELPDAFLRRCLFHYIRFPEQETMQQIVDVHFPGIEKELVGNAMSIFYGIRDIRGLKKKPSTSELIDWLKLLLMEKIQSGELEDFDLKETLPPHTHALLKNEQDLNLLDELRRMKRKY